MDKSKHARSRTDTTPSDTNTYLKAALRMAKLTGTKLASHFGKQATTTRGTAKEIKSKYDKVADKIIKQAIEKQFPTHSYLTEETGLIDKKSPYLWIIDPLDGTGNFVNANPFFAVSIALWINGQPEIAVIEAPALGQRYVAQKNQGAWVINTENNQKKPARVSQVKKLSEAYIVYCDGGCTKTPRITKFLDDLYPKTKDMRKLGSAAIELAWVGIGRAEAYITPEISIWDIAAGVLFVKEAGGQIRDFQGKTWKWSKLLTKDAINLIAISRPNLINSISY